MRLSSFARGSPLDALVVEPPVAFVRFSIEVWNPMSVTDPAVQAVEQVLGRPVRLLGVRS